jgi:hypothetical protein
LNLLDRKAQALGMETVTASVFADGEFTANIVRNDPWSQRMMAAEGANEVSITWTDEDTGIRCKGRLDRLVTFEDGSWLIPDLKTTRDARRRAFTRQVLAFGYHIKAAFYCRGLRANGAERVQFSWIAVEKDADVVKWWNATPQDLKVGDEQVSWLLRAVKNCLDTGEWPGYGPPESLHLPILASRESEID